MKSTVTQQSIAAHLGIDQRTVSQALAGKPGIAAATRERVLQAARELGYRPNFSAQAIRNGTQKRIGLLTGTNSSLSSLPQDRLKGMQAAARQAGYGLSLVSFPDEQMNDPDQMSRFLGGFGVDGVLMNYSSDRAGDPLPVLQSFHLPVVSVNSMQPEDAVYPDNQGLAEELVRHLTAHGYQRFFFVGYGERMMRGGILLPAHFSEEERRRGVEKEARRRKLPFRSLFCRDCTPELIRDITSAPGRAALICYNDASALHVYGCFLQAGLLPPESALLCHFNWRPLFDELLDRRLRPILLPEHKVGLAAVQMLLRRMTDGRPQPAQAIGLRRGVLEYLTGDCNYCEHPAGMEPQDD